MKTRQKRGRLERWTRNKKYPLQLIASNRNNSQIYFTIPTFIHEFMWLFFNLILEKVYDLTFVIIEKVCIFLVFIIEKMHLCNINILNTDSYEKKDIQAVSGFQKNQDKTNPILLGFRQASKTWITHLHERIRRSRLDGKYPSHRH